MAFLPNNKNYRSYSNIFQTQDFKPVNNINLNNNSPIFQSKNPRINKRIITKRVIPVMNAPTRHLRTNSNFIVPISHSNRIIGNNPNNIYINQSQLSTNIFQRQNINKNLSYQMPRNNIYTTTSQSINPLYSNLGQNIGIEDEDFLREKPFYNRPSELLPVIKNKGFPKKAYVVSMIPNHLLFPERKDPKPPSPSNNNPPQPPKPPKPPKPSVDKKVMEEKLKEKIFKDNLDMQNRQEKMRNHIDEQIKPPVPIIKTPEEIKKENNNKLNQILEDMCIYGNTAKERIIEEKQKNPEKYITTKKALEKEKEDPELFALGLIASVLEKNEIETAIINDDYIKKEKIEGKNKEEIQKELEKKDQEETEAITSLQFLSNGWIGKKKYDLSFDFDDDRVNEILFDPIEYNKFKEKLKDKISKDYNVPKDKIIVTFPQIGSLRVQVIFQSDEFNDLKPDEFKEKFKNDPEFEELNKIKDVQVSVIMSGCKLSKAQLDVRGNRIQWPKNEKRGGEKYNAPEGWIGIGLKAFDKYSNDQWLDMQNKEGEWVVAYHGVGNLVNPKDVNAIPKSIYEQGFKVGKRQAHKDCEDYFHPGQKVGEGIYCTPRIDIAEQYAGNSELNGVEYKTVIMCRVNPKARRHCHKCEESRVNEYWVVNGTPDEIRPYRILYKCDVWMNQIKKAL